MYRRVRAVWCSSNWLLLFNSDGVGVFIIFISNLRGGFPPRWFGLKNYPKLSNILVREIGYEEMALVCVLNFRMYFLQLEPCITRICCQKVSLIQQIAVITPSICYWGVSILGPNFVINFVFHFVFIFNLRGGLPPNTKTYTLSCVSFQQLFSIFFAH